MQGVQLRLDFAAPSGPVTMHLTLSGLVVEVDADDVPLARAHLEYAGIHPRLGDGHGLSFQAAEFGRLARLPEQVTISADRILRPLLELVQSPSHAGRPATLSSELGGLWLSWYDGQVEHHEQLPAAAAAVLVTCSDLPFVADDDAFAALRTTSRLPVLLGTGQVTHDGFIQIETSKPQLVEDSGLPGLFRIDSTHFGIALPHADAFGMLPGFAWATREPPTLEHGPSVLPTLPIPLSTHAAGDLRRLVDNLAAYRAQAVVWGSGLGRRIFTIAAVEALDAWPLLIVCTPATVWAWQRHLELFGRTGSLTHEDEDARLITYEELTRARPRTGPATIVLDGLGEPGVLTRDRLAGLRRLDVYADAYRIAISSAWPSDPSRVVELMSVLRPAEFRPGQDLATRYPGNASDGLSAHVRAYVTTRSVQSAGNDTRTFRRSRTVTCRLTESQKDALAVAVKAHGHTPAALLVEALEIGSCGPELALSPKIAAVVTRAREALTAGRRVVMVTRHRRTVDTLKAMLREPGLEVAEAGTGASPVPHVRAVIVRFDLQLPDLRWFDDVFVVDYPWSASVLDSAVGPATDERGPVNVTVFHLAGSLDDRLALLAARRNELGPVLEQAAPPDSDEITYLLGALRP